MRNLDACIGNNEDLIISALCGAGTYDSFCIWIQFPKTFTFIQKLSNCTLIETNYVIGKTLKGVRTPENSIN